MPFEIEPLEILISSKVFKYERPESSTDTDAEAWEFYLVWLGVDGGVYSWLFTDFEIRNRISGDIINAKTENISKLYQNAEQTVRLVAEDLTENEFDVISDITRALVVRRYYKDGTYDNLAIVTDRINKPKSQFRYNLNLEVQKVELPIMK